MYKYPRCKSTLCLPIISTDDISIAFFCGLYRERDATREAALRKAAEERFEKLVDMYGDPAVNEELRTRLPRAAKTDPKVIWQEELDNMPQRDADMSTEE